MTSLHLLLALLLSTMLTLALPQRDTADITFEDKAASLQDSGRPSNLPRPPCPIDEFFACRSDEQICSLNVCDGIVDCKDGSDELDCRETVNDDPINVPRQPCPGDNFYTCASGDVICDVNVCNGVTDCPDWDDEESCECKDYQFLCDGTRCVSFSLMCDGIRDCLDGTDETDCNFPNTTTTLPTTITTTAIPTNAITTTTTTTPNIAITKTIPTTAVTITVDTPITTIVSTPTTTTTTTSEPLTCRNNHAPRYCNDGETLVCFCDGVVECPRGEDEKYCQQVSTPTTTTTTTSEPLTCRNNHAPRYCNDGETLVCFCDGVVECPRGEDEKYCQQACRPEEWRCRCDDSCISKHRICDRFRDCPDGSDEHGCVPGQKWWRCRRGGWILLNQRCDGRLDCRDASDEHSCRHHHHCYHGRHDLLFFSLLQHKVKQLQGFIED